MKRLLLLITLFLPGCATVDVDKRVRDSGSGRQEAAAQTGTRDVLTVPLEIDIPPEVIVVERPVYVPDIPAPPQRPAGVPAVQNSNSAGIVKPSEFSHAAMVYDYGDDWVYEVYTQPLRASDIQLEPGEQVAESPFVSDSDRWMLGAGVHYALGVPTQHIYVKPTAPSLEASLIINTNRRVYRIILRSFQSVHMPIVRWRYPRTGMPDNYIPPPETPSAEDADPLAPAGIDPRYLSFNYRITYGWFSKPVWLPELAYDDGKKTYISFPESVLQRELPAVFENRRDVVNYRVSGRIIIIDKLIEQITIKIGRTEITVAKKRG